MVRIEFTGSAAEVLAEMRALAFVEPIVPPPPAVQRPLDEADIAADAAYVVDPDKIIADLDNIIAKQEAAERESELPLEAPPADPAPSPRKPRTKAETEAARAAEAAAATALVEPGSDEFEDLKRKQAEEFSAALTPPEANVETNKPIDFDDCKDALKNICETEGLGVEAAQKLLKEFGVARLSLLAPAQYVEFYRAATGLEK